MANINVTIRLDAELKAEADALFSRLGMSINTAVNVFVRQAVREGRIPFEICDNPGYRNSPVVIPGCYRRGPEPRVEYAVVELPEVEG